MTIDVPEPTLVGSRFEMVSVVAGSDLPEAGGKIVSEHAPGSRYVMSLFTGPPGVCVGGIVPRCYGDIAKGQVFWVVVKGPVLAKAIPVSVPAEFVNGGQDLDG